MNRYTALGIMSDALQGRRVLVVSPNQRALGEAFGIVKHIAQAVAPTCKHTAGEAHIILPTGTHITFTTPRGMRGRSADVVVIEDEMGMDRNELALAHAVIATRQHGEVIAL